MYPRLVSHSPIDLCRAINVSSERNPRRERESRRKRLKNLRTTGDDRFLPSRNRGGTNDKAGMRASIAKGAADRSSASIVYLTGRGKSRVERKKSGGKSGRSHQTGSSGRRTSFKDFSPHALGDASPARVEIADRSSDFSG